jgi:hypothetical protein
MIYRGQGPAGDPAKRKKRGGKRKKRGGKQGRPGPPRMGPPRRRPKGHCLCPTCGTKVAVYTEVPCYIMHCPKCGSKMVKESPGRNPQENIQPR